MTSDNQIYIPLCIYFNPEFFVAAPPSKLHLHSTMYLFQLLLAGLFPILLIFTFHYVSISTFYFEHTYHTLHHLHSTMYLFQPLSSHILKAGYINLHSTMYLFQHSPISPERWRQMLFTFHYVSISTRLIIVRQLLPCEFTFHYVSISTVLHWHMHWVLS